MPPVPTATADLTSGTDNPHGQMTAMHSNETDTARWLNRNVLGLGVNRFLSDLGHEAGTAILPLFLAAIGAPPYALGLIEGAADALSSFTKLLGGWLGDRIARRRGWAALGYALTGVTTGLYGVFSAWPWVFFVRAIGWAGRGLRSPLHDALLTDSVAPAARGRAFGFDEAADTAGAMLGPPAALGIVFLLGQALGETGAYRFAFWLAAVPGILAAVSILVLVRETRHPILPSRGLRPALRLLPLSFRRYTLAVLIFGCGDFSHTLLILYASTSLAPAYQQASGIIAIALYTLHNVLYAAGAYPVGVMADRFGKNSFLVGAYLLAVLMNIVLVAAIPSVATLIIVFALAGAAYAAQQSLERAIAADLLPDTVRSTGFGVLAAANGVGDFVSSVIVGVLWTQFSPTVAFAFALIVTLVGAGFTAVTLFRRSGR